MATKKATQVVVNNITIKPTSRKSTDIQVWRDAIKSFESTQNPNRVKLYDLYSDMLLDGHLEAVWGKRQDAICNKQLTFVKDGMPDEEIDKLLNSPDMRNLLKDLIDAILWGYTLVQINSILWNEDEERYEINYDLIPRKHVHPEKGFECVSRDQAQATRDILYKEPPLSKYLLWAGSTDMGLLIKASQYVIYKRGNFGDWAQFAELFGMPFREARYDDYDDDTRSKLESAMEYYGGASYAILPKSADFKMHDAVKGTAGQLYKLLHDACNAEMSKAILGNTLTTEQGDNGARSLGEVHQDAEDAKHLSDMKFISDILNTKFKAILKTFGFNVAGGFIMFKSADPNWSNLKVKWDVLNSFSDKVPVSDDFMYQEMGIPKPDNYDELKEAMQTNMLPDASASDNKKLNAPVQRKLSALNRILDFFV